MSIRKITKRPLQKIQTGDMRERISFYSRAVTPPTFNSASITQKYELIIDIWARVITLDPGKNVFSDVDIGLQPTHQFVTRHWPDITAETVIKWNNKNYDIVKIVNPEERDEYLFIWAKLLGIDTLGANK